MFVRKICVFNVDEIDGRDHPQLVRIKEFVLYT